MRRTNEREKVVHSSEIEFVNEVANDCILNMSDKDKGYLIDNPRAIDYHFSDKDDKPLKQNMFKVV